MCIRDSSESVLDEMLLGISSKDKKENTQKAKSILNVLGLDKYIDKHPFALSRGEKQRLTIACGMMKQAKVFIYDEPTSGCDKDSMLSVAKLIEEQLKNGTTVLVISHDFEFLANTVSTVSYTHLCIIVKDMSRLGRDYLKVGQCMEILRQKGVRLIAINDNVDSFYREDDFTPFRNIMNEWYARDTSRKIQSTFRSKGESGKHTASTPPYGYIKDEKDKNKWIVDEKAAEIVRRIFNLTRCV